jgi:hypothetical protein
MNASALFDMLSAQAAAQDNAPAMDMLARLRAGGPQPTTEELIGQIQQTNPMLGLLAQQMAQRIPTRPPADVIDVEPSDPEANAAAEAAARAAAEAAAVSHRAEQLAGELEWLRERLDLLADALGACGLCWGEDAQCRACHGRGGPGYALPDESLFDELVGPAVRMLRANQTGAPGRAPPNPVAASAPARAPNVS